MKMPNSQTAATLAVVAEPMTQKRGRLSDMKMNSMPIVSEDNHNIIRAENCIRCRQCKSQTIFSCSRCQVELHPKCFEAYHL